METPNPTPIKGTKDKTSSKDHGPVVIPTIQALRNGTLSPKAVPAKVRQMCVEDMIRDGTSTSEIAFLFKKSERTIFRDVHQIHAQIVERVGPLQSKSLLSYFLRSMEVCGQRGRRAARDKTATPSDKINAERLVCDVLTKQITVLARLGYVHGPIQDGELQIDIYYDDVGQTPKPTWYSENT